MPSCTQCHRDVQAEWKFCRFCGQALAPTAPSADEPIGGLLTPELLAHRVRPGDMKGLLTRTLVVEEGQAALLLIGGRHDETLGPGNPIPGHHQSFTASGGRGRNTTPPARPGTQRRAIMGGFAAGDAGLRQRLSSAAVPLLTPELRRGLAGPVARPYSSNSSACSATLRKASAYSSMIGGR